MARFKANILANYVGKSWQAFAGFVFLPFYLHILGAENYALVGFSTVLTAAIAFADFGLRATLTREIASLSVREGQAREMRVLSRTVELLYLGISSLILIGIVGLARPMAEYWFNKSTVPANTIAISLMLMGVSLALQFPTSLYQGGMVGLQRHLSNNSLLVISGLFRQLGALLVLKFVAASIIGFYLWIILVDLIFLIIWRRTYWRLLPETDGRVRGIDLPTIRRIGGFTAGMFLISVNAIFLGQADKLLVSKLLPMSIFSYYTVAVALAMACVSLINPIAIAAFPRFTEMYAERNGTGMSLTYQKCIRLVAVVSFPIAAMTVFASKLLLTLWTNNQDLAINAYMATSLLACGFALYGIQIIPFNLIVSLGYIKSIAWVGWIGLGIYLPVTFLLVKNYGLTGAGMSWLGLQIIVTTAYLIILRTSLYRIKLWDSIIRDNLAAAVVSVCCVLTGVFFAKTYVDIPLAGLVVILISCMVSGLVNYAVLLKKLPLIPYSESIFKRCLRSHEAL